MVRLTTGPAVPSPHACGGSLLPTAEDAHFITIFVECIRDASHALHIREDVLLGAAIAHEIGHLLLGPAHSPRGLMQACPPPIDWARAVRGGLTFSTSEAERLRDALVARERRQQRKPDRD